MGGILGERHFVYLERKVACDFTKESIVCFEPKGVGGILGERTFCVFAKKKCVFFKKKALSALNQKVWEEF